jgi:hypothetical protein
VGAREAPRSRKLGQEAISLLRGWAEPESVFDPYGRLSPAPGPWHHHGQRQPDPSMHLDLAADEVLFKAKAVVVAASPGSTRNRRHLRDV